MQQVQGAYQHSQREVYWEEKEGIHSTNCVIQGRQASVAQQKQPQYVQVPTIFSNANTGHKYSVTQGLRLETQGAVPHILCDFVIH